MIELTWFEAVPPRDAAYDDLTQMVRVLAARPHHGLRHLQPLVVFEVCLHADRVQWLVGVEPQLARTLPGELAAQLPQLTLTESRQPARPAPVTARELRLTSLIYPLRVTTARAVTAGLFQAQRQLRAGEAVTVQWVVGPSQARTQVPVPESPLELLGFATRREPSGDEQRAWKQKLAEPLFGIRGRVGAVAGDPRRAAELLRPAVSALSLVSGSHSRLYASPQSSKTAAQLYQVMGRMRSWSGIANAAELAVMMGWCLGGLDVPGGAGRFALVPPSLLRDTPPRPATADRPVGISTHPASRGQGVWLPRRSYSTGSHVIGPTGRGKSTLLTHWAVREAQAGGSVVVLEPKSDLVTDIAARLGDHGNVIIIEPGTDGPVIGFNPLAGPRHDAERRADAVLGLLRDVFGSAIGPRSNDILLHALLIAARLDDGTLCDVLPILGNAAYRRAVAAKVGDPLTVSPWLAWFDKLSDEQRTQVVMPVRNKLTAWTARPAIRHLLGQPAPKFDLAQVFDRPTILLVSLNAGLLGPEAASLLGSLLLQHLWHLVQRQTTRPAAFRRPVTVMVDEWHTFTAGLDFGDALARARGAGVNFVAAHQNLGQLSPALRSAALANLGTQVVFRPAEEDARPLARVLGEPVTPDDLMGLGAHHAAVKTTVDGNAKAAFEVVTPALSDALRDPAELRRTSAERFGTDPAAIDAALLNRWAGQAPPDGPIGVRRTSQ
ncbi:type IV secretory system conjugative DNA transfer family protein [Amycolatopsis sp. RTGN1]|uniref:type IV secretory system conjugative DNA transfer family protein n=1 Tax=Amycolatopsis ponsaeliensis TaxID=2992142 RepID=UPI00254D8A16|nr:TraM recognition domain-containing protein [Amycolatopsis sp. RTGN1]